MKRITNIRTLATLLMASAAIVSCSVKEDIFEEETTIKEEPAKVYTLSVNATKGGDDEATKALSLEGKTLNAKWAQNEEVTVFNKTKKVPLDGTLKAQSDGSSTTLKGSLTGTIENGDVLILRFNSANYGSQSGTLDYIAANCDFAEATITVSSVDGENNVIPTSTASFVNQQAIVKFTLKDKDDASALSVNKLFVTVGGTTCEVTPAAAMSELYVAVPAVASGRVTLTAQKTSLGFTFYYDYLKTGATFAQGQYYAINASLTLVKNINVATTASLGRVVAADGMMYACVESATNAGTTAIAVITERNSYASTYGAIAISEESWGMNWSDAKSACEGKTPKLDGANWRFPTVDQWKSMCAANGGNEYNYTGLDALITKAGGSPLRTDWFYWTSSPDEDNSNYKYHVSFNGNGSLYFRNGQDQSNEVYVRAFLYFVGN